MNNKSNLNKHSIQRVFVISIFMALYIILSLFSFLLLVDFKNDPEPVDVSTISEETRRGITKEAERLVISVDDFIEQYVVSTHGIEVQVNDALLILIILIILFPLAYFLFTSIVLKHFDASFELFTPQELDMMRKRDLEKLRLKLDTYFSQHQRYPNEEEYGYLINELEGIIHDPKFDQPIKNRPKEVYGYNYDQYNPTTQKTDQHYFRIWCYLEEGDRFFITPEGEYTEKREEHVQN